MCHINRCSLFTVCISMHQYGFTQIGVLLSRNWTINIMHKHSNIVVMSFQK